MALFDLFICEEEGGGRADVGIMGIGGEKTGGGGCCCCCCFFAEGIRSNGMTGGSDDAGMKGVGLEAVLGGKVRSKLKDCGG